MSCRWFVYCRTCDEQGPGGDGFNNRPEPIRAVIRAAVPLGEAAKVLAGEEARLELVYGYHFGLDFFAEHGAHDLAPRDEYGDFET